MASLADTLLAKAKALPKSTVKAPSGEFVELRPSIVHLVNKGYQLTEIQNWIAKQVAKWRFERNTPQWWRLYHYIRRVRGEVQPEAVRPKPRRTKV